MHAWSGKAWSVPGALLTTRQHKRLQMLKAASPELAGVDLHSSCLRHASLYALSCHDLCLAQSAA